MFKAGRLAWILVHGIMEEDLGPISVGLKDFEVMIKRDGRGHPYYGGRGEIRGSP